MSLSHVSRLNLISEIEKDQFCEVAGVNCHKLILVPKRIVYKNGIKNKTDESCFVHVIRSCNIVASIVHPFLWPLYEHSGFIYHTQNRRGPHPAYCTVDSTYILHRYKVAFV
jgi:hypothetical protein